MGRNKGEVINKRKINFEREREVGVWRNEKERKSRKGREEKKRG
jgi:hypothetical protein